MEQVHVLSHLRCIVPSSLVWCSSTACSVEARTCSSSRSLTLTTTEWTVCRGSSVLQMVNISGFVVHSGAVRTASMTQYAVL
jgi:hypothetical protein